MGRRVELQGIQYFDDDDKNDCRPVKVVINMETHELKIGNWAMDAYKLVPVEEETEETEEKKSE